MGPEDIEARADLAKRLTNFSKIKDMELVITAMETAGTSTHFHKFSDDAVVRDRLDLIRQRNPEWFEPATPNASAPADVGSELPPAFRDWLSKRKQLADYESGKILGPKKIALVAHFEQQTGTQLPRRKSIPAVTVSATAPTPAQAASIQPLRPIDKLQAGRAVSEAARLQAQITNLQNPTGQDEPHIAHERRRRIEVATKELARLKQRWPGVIYNGHLQN